MHQSESSRTSRIDFGFTVAHQSLSSTTLYENHVNTYFHAKTIGEGCVNAIFTPQNGRALHSKAARILRLSTIGPSLNYPRPAWGAGHPSSPLCAAIAAVPLQSLSHLADGAFLDGESYPLQCSLAVMLTFSDALVIPVDVAVNQIIAITAATHRTHKLPTDNISHPRNASNPVNQHGHNVPVYNIASGLSGPHNIQIKTLNESSLKIEEPYVPEKSLMKVYRPFMIKKLDFCTQRASKVMQITNEQYQEQSLVNMVTEKMGLKGQIASSLSSSVTAKNLNQEWSDPPIDCGHLDVDVARSIGLQQQIKEGTPQLAWHKYITLVRDEMERRGPRAEWTSFVD